MNDPEMANPGGVQASGRVALEGLRSAFDVEALLVASGKRALSQALLRAVKPGSTSDVVLFWHTDLLKLMPLLPLRGSCRKVVFLHGIEIWRKRGAITRFALKRCDAVLSNTAYTFNRARTVVAELASARSRVVHLGLDDALANIPAHDRVPAALMVSRLHPDERYKGHDEILAAWPLVIERIPGAQLWVAGEGELQPELEHIAARNGLHDSVRFFGRITDAEKQQLIGRSRCLLMPSTGEGFGLVYLEAMRQGRPCLTGIDGGREVVNPPEAGLSVTHRTPQEIADAVVRLMRADSAWLEMSARAKKRYEQQFTARHFTERLNQVIAEVALT